MPRLIVVVMSALIFFSGLPAFAQDEQGAKSPPPAKVVVVKSVVRAVMPRTAYVGTVYFPEVSDVAAEVSGRVEKVTFEEGDLVRAGQRLVILDTTLVRKSLAAAKAALAEARASLDRERAEYERLRLLFESRTISEQDYDDSRFRVIELERRGDALDANVAKMSIELDKASIKAPYSGVVLHRDVDRGEWLAPGKVFGTLARNDVVDVKVNVPGSVLPRVSKGMRVPVRIGSTDLTGEVSAVIPVGDIATRTFPVKIRIATAKGLAQGMDATVNLPAGPPVQSVVVPRDAVITSMQGTVVFAVKNGAAVLIPVRVSEYVGLEAAVEGAGLDGGMDIVVKGNERLRPGQPVSIVTN